MTAWRPGDRFVIHRHEDPRVTGLYVDIVRESRLRETRFEYVDLYVDVLSYGGRVWSKDEELLERLAADDAREVLHIRDGLLARLRACAEPFEVEHPRWTVPEDARALAPGDELGLAD